MLRQHADFPPWTIVPQVIAHYHFFARAPVPMSITGLGGILLLRPLRYSGKQYMMPLRAKPTDPRFVNTKENVPHKADPFC